MILGIIYKDGKVINHRSLFKVIFNPIFRMFGFCIGTPFDKNRVVGFMRIVKLKQPTFILWKAYDCPYDHLVKTRRIF